eukprot:TRINITY_DN30909_c0_g1_i1.p1 TRINITY_DN30909_c0_g1~~TRINITY_DN30909_c0_g1_i1.p1  ORF type:complete len:271 (+),score=40.75 TRINITY_DN30909_c0_g1_i1:71-883(+)
MPASASFRETPLAFFDDDQAEIARIHKLRMDDPIAFQDAVNTSRALVDAVKENDLEELRRIVAEAEDGEFIQAFIVQALVLALKATSLDTVKQLVEWGIPLGNDQFAQAIHMVCEITNRENFSNAWRIVEILMKGNSQGKLDINTPRVGDGWTPLCVACAGACLPLVFKLLELGADPNTITQDNDTPVSLAKRPLSTDDEEQKEARNIISNMLRSYGGQERWQDALRQSRRPPRPAPKEASSSNAGYAAQPGANNVVAKAVSQTHTRYTG